MKKSNGYTVKIDKGVALPTNRAGRNGFYPYLKMKVGDSFLIPRDLKPNSAYNIGREGNRQAMLAGEPHRFKAGKTPKGLRCWRVV